MNSTQGFEISANNTFQFPDAKIQAIFEIGFRQFYFSGNSNTLTYKGQLNKLIGAIGSRYSISKKFGLAGFIEAENNLALDDFNTGTGDLFRICLSLESSYSVTDRLGVTVLLSWAMTPISEGYIIHNPQYQLRFGLNYTFVK